MGITSAKDLVNAASDEDRRSDTIYRIMDPQHLIRIEKKLDLILQRIGQLKTREADEEADNQKSKAHERYEAKKVEGK